MDTLLSTIPECFYDRLVPTQGKAPTVLNWNTTDFPIEILSDHNPSSIGVKTGLIPDETAGILCLDFDNCEDQMPDKLGGMVVRSPRLNYCKVFFYLYNTDDEFRLLEKRFKGKGRTSIPLGKGKIEVFWGKNQSQAIVAGKHPEGEYRFIGGQPDLSGEGLYDFIAQLSENLTKAPVVDAVAVTDTDADTNLALVKHILNTPEMTSDEFGEYNNWFKVLAILKYAGEADGNEAEYLALAHEWSAQVPNYDGMEAVNKTWVGINNTHKKPATLGSLIFTAKQLGVKFPAPTPAPVGAETPEGKLVEELIHSSSPEDWGTALAKYYSDKLLVNQADLDEIYFYDDNKKYFRKINQKYLTREIKPFLNQAHNAQRFNNKWKLTNDKRRQGVENLLFDSCVFPEDLVFNPHRTIIPMKDFSLDTQTMEIIEHSPLLRNDFVLPYNYDPNATCPLLDKILEHAFGGQFFDELAMSYKCFCLVSLHGINTHQKFLEIVGEPGSSKGLLGRFFHTLIGYDNVYATSLKNLENSRFNAYNYVNKRAVFINEVGKEKLYLKQFYNLTGGDAVEAEVKGVQDTKILYFTGNVLLTANRHLQSKDDSTALERRRVSIVTERVVPENDRDPELLFFTNKIPQGKLIHELPGFFNQLLDTDLDFAIKYLMRSSSLPSQKYYRLQIIPEMSTVADWAMTAISEGDVAVCNIKLSSNDSNCPTLLRSYTRWCLENNVYQVHSARSFRKELDKVLKMRSIKHVVKTPKNKVTYYGLIVNPC